MSLVLIVFPVIIHNKVTKKKSWYQCVRDGYYIGPAPKHYLCFNLIDKQTKYIVVADTVYFLHSYLS